MRLEGKAAIVTGAGSGVGRATALALARRGCSVLVNYLKSQAEADQTAAEARRLGVRALAMQADVASDRDCRRLVARALQEFGALHVLVNNAGYTRFITHRNLEEVRDEDWDRILAVNVKAPFQCARAARDALLASGGGEIVNVSSVAATSAGGSSIPYCASKAALNNLTVSLARALAPEVRVNAVAPGFIDGRWTRQGLGQAYEHTKAALEKHLPLRQVCTPDDIAETILGVISGSDLVTGQVFVCDGGSLIMQPPIV